MATFKFSVGQVGILDYLIVIARKSTAPLAEAARQTFPGPQPTTRNIEFDNLDPAIYYFDWRESADGVDLGILLATFTVDVANQRILLERRFYQTGGTGDHDPVPDDNKIVDPYLNGKNITGVFKEGFRYLVSPDYTYKEFEPISGGGVQLLGSLVFSADEIVAVEISYSDLSSSTSGGSFPLDFILKTADFTLDSSYYNVVIEANKAGTTLLIGMPALTSIPDGTKFGINTHQATQRQVNLQLGVGDYCLVGGNQRNSVFVGKGEEVVFQKKGLYLRVLSWAGDWRRVGELVEQDTPPLNAIPETGSWQLFTDYLRLFYWYINVLPGGQLGTGTYPTIPDPNNNTKWIIDGANGRFWVPDSRECFNKATNGGNPSVFEPQSIQDHRHWAIYDLLRSSSLFPENRGSQLTPFRSPIRYWNKVSSGAEGYDLDSEPGEPTLGRTSLPTTASGALIGSSRTQPNSVYRNFYRII
jgi:hypothetical protein